MSQTRQLAVVAILALALAAGLAGGPELTARTVAPGDVPDDVRARPLGFAPSVAAADREVVLAAIAAARPEARALVERVDGMVTVEVGPTGTDAVGLTAGARERGYTVTLDLGVVARGLGDRGVKRLVLHELGHVVDHALLDAERQRALDAGIPQGYACRPGEPTGACATREERFAETFAKWAHGDIGINVSLGYKVPPPPSLDAWGEGLAGL